MKYNIYKTDNIHSNILKQINPNVKLFALLELKYSKKNLTPKTLIISIHLSTKIAKHKICLFNKYLFNRVVISYWPNRSHVPQINKNNLFKFEYFF